MYYSIFKTMDRLKSAHPNNFKSPPTCLSNLTMILLRYLRLTQLYFCFGLFTENVKYFWPQLYILYLIVGFQVKETIRFLRTNFPVIESTASTAMLFTSLVSMYSQLGRAALRKISSSSVTVALVIDGSFLPLDTITSPPANREPHMPNVPTVNIEWSLEARTQRSKPIMSSGEILPAL